jgi:phospholipase C
MAGGSSSFAGWSGACSGTADCALTVSKNVTVTATFSAFPTLMVSLAGTGSGSVVSNDSAINCGQTCSATYSGSPQITLTATPGANSLFGGWSGACSGTGPCVVTVNSNQSVTATFNAMQTVQVLNHIVFMLQENRALDHYFGAMRQYWEDNGYPDQPFDGLPQFPISNPSGPAPTNPGCDPAFPYPADCTNDSNSPTVQSYHLVTMCVENPSPSWNESHTVWNLLNPVSQFPTLDGFVWAAGHDSRNMTPPFFDVDGVRTMGYYNGNDLNYYYFMATNFATSDSWFSPVMSRTALNRMYLLAGTSHGHAYPLNTSGSPQLSDAIIFQILQQNGISWRIYVHPGPDGKTDTKSLYDQSYIQNFTYGNTILNQYPQNIQPIAQYYLDVQNGTLPAVAMIEPASEVALDEHPSDTDTTTPPNIQPGANYVSGLINALMTSPSWSDSVFILSFDEFGGFYDHVPPQPTVSPDGIAPTDLLPGDVCTKVTGPTCDFTYTGYRVPLIVVSPYTRKNYVSHTTADYTAILKLIETRFNLPSLTARDAAQMDMTEFFDFNNPAWLVPPTPPTQVQNGACYLDHLP